MYIFILLEIKFNLKEKVFLCYFLFKFKKIRNFKAVLLEETSFD